MRFSSGKYFPALYMHYDGQATWDSHLSPSSDLGTTTAEAIQSLTRQPAELYSLMDRGLLVPGMKADINLIDPDRLAIVTGKLFFEDGVATGALPGKLVRCRQSDPRQVLPTL